MIYYERRTRRGYLFPVTRAECLYILHALLGVLELEKSTLDFLLVDDCDIAGLNEKYLGCVGPTNVLSFPPEVFENQEGAEYEEECEACKDGPVVFDVGEMISDEDFLGLQQESLAEQYSVGTEAATESGTEDGGVDLGVLALSVEAVVREAYLYGQEPREHFIRLVAHGLLHLAGYDHGERMEERTERMMAAVRTMV